MEFIRNIGWLIIALLTFVSLANGQSRWTLSATVAPLYGYISTKQDLEIPGTNAQLYPTSISSQSSEVGYRLGLMGHYDINAHWSLSTGLWMSYRKANAPDVQASINIDYGSYPYRKRTYQIPLLVNYQLSNRRVRPYFSAGVLATFRSKTQLIISPDQEITVESGKKDITFQPTLGAGIIYRLNEHIHLVAQPMISYILPEYDYVVYHAYALSLQTQLLYKF